MPLLSKELKEAFTAKKVSSSAGNELYFNPASVDAKKKARFTILARDEAGHQRRAGGDRFHLIFRGVSAPRVLA